MRASDRHVGRVGRNRPLRSRAPADTIEATKAIIAVSMLLAGLIAAVAFAAVVVVLLV